MKIGIIGTGRIAERFVRECAFVPGVEIAVVYNPNIESARFFTDTYFVAENEHNEVMATDKLSTLAMYSDSVYIASPHEMHVFYAREMLMQGKHVLCEKPMAFSTREAMELYELAKRSKLILMEAVKTACCPGFLGLMKLVNEGAIGTPRDVEACFTRIGTAAGREMLGEYPGSFYELGSYPLLPIVKILGTESFESYIWTLDSASGADAYAKCVIAYQNGIASAKTGLGVKSEGELIVAGETGYIRIPSPWWLTSKIEVHHEDPNLVETYEYSYEGSGLRYEITEFSNRITAIEKIISAYADESLREVAWDEISKRPGVTPNESIWMASQMENFESYVKAHREQGLGQRLGIPKNDVKIWAHRGCSLTFPENTLVAFEAAAKLPGITGIELNTQLTKDGEVVVIHDEKLDRTTNLSGSVSDYTLSEIKRADITGSGNEEVYEHGTLNVPALKEVLELLKPYCTEKGLLINIELKNGMVPYEGMEQKVVELVHSFEMEEYIIYSSFNHSSMQLIKRLVPGAKTGALGGSVTGCLNGMKNYGLEAVHPGRLGMEINKDTVEQLIAEKIPVRMWNTDEPFYGQTRPLHSLDYREYAAFGITDLFTNVPEKYLTIN